MNYLGKVTRVFAGIIMLAIIVLICTVSAVQCQDTAQDSSSFNFKGWTLRKGIVPIGAIIGASELPDTQLEAKPFIGGGYSLIITRNRLFGFSLSALFYTNGDNASVIAAVGPLLFPQNPFTVQIGWDFGETPAALPEYKKRIVFLFGYNLLSLVGR